ncbi:LOW QUALITY PROTEIN: hypothetical protein CFOL_v3_32525, partial [Cephalotus follicularis]
YPYSLPDPPHIKKRRKLTWHERYLICLSFIHSFYYVRDIGPNLRPNDYKKDEETENKPKGARNETNEKVPSVLDDLVVAARGGMETLRPTLQSAYKDALKSFIEGYQESVQQVMEKTED